MKLKAKSEDSKHQYTNIEQLDIHWPTNLAAMKLFKEILAWEMWYRLNKVLQINMAVAELLLMCDKWYWTNQ